MMGMRDGDSCWLLDVLAWGAESREEGDRGLGNWGDLGREERQDSFDSVSV